MGSVHGGDPFPSFSRLSRRAVPLIICRPELPLPHTWMARERGAGCVPGFHTRSLHFVVIKSLGLRADQAWV